MSSLMLQYSIMKHSKKTTKNGKLWHVKNSIISINKRYQETMYQNLSYDIYHARNGPISKETFNPWLNMVITKICLVPYNHGSQTSFVQMDIMIYMWDSNHQKLSSPHKPYYNLRSNLFYVSGQSVHVTLSPISLNPDMKQP